MLMDILTILSIGISMKIFVVYPNKIFISVKYIPHTDPSIAVTLPTKFAILSYFLNNKESIEPNTKIQIKIVKLV